MEMQNVGVENVGVVEVYVIHYACIEMEIRVDREGVRSVERTQKVYYREDGNSWYMDKMVALFSLERLRRECAQNNYWLTKVRIK